MMTLLMVDHGVQSMWMRKDTTLKEKDIGDIVTDYALWSSGVRNFFIIPNGINLLNKKLYHEHKVYLKLVKIYSQNSRSVS